MPIIKLIPRPLRQPLREMKNYFAWMAYRGHGRHCPVCGEESSRFGTFGRPARPDARCMRCGSLERHRLARLYFERRTDLFTEVPARMLHVAPEPIFEKLLKKRVGAGYLSADLDGSQAMVKMDITAIDYPDQLFDVIYCSHVLEHVSDDRKTMRELYRVMRPDGWAVLMVPVTAEQTVEDPSITDPAERERLFGQADHFRRYGPDFADRLKECGFAVTRTSPSDFLTPDEISRMGITAAAGDIYHCARS